MIPNTPDKEQVVLRFVDTGVTVKNWTSYSFNSHFLTPSDAFSFTVSDHALPAAVQDSLILGARVRLLINDIVLADGHIDTVNIKADRSGGWVYEISGRDRLALAVDSVMDPAVQFKEKQSLADAMKSLFQDFGWSSDDSFIVDNTANRNLQTGAVRGLKASKAKRTFGRPLKNIALHQLKPYNHEGVFAFASRICQRFGLWIWTSVDGEKLIFGKPDFDQDPMFVIRRTKEGTNVLSGNASFSLVDQPSLIVADSFSGSAEFGKGRNKAICVNPFFGVDQNGDNLPAVAKIVAKYPKASVVKMGGDPPKGRATGMPIRPLYLHDDESKSQEQLDNFVRREMSLLMRKSLTCHYTCEGHGQINEAGDFVAWAPDTVVDVQDDVTGVHERLYVLSRTFTKSRNGGTHTELELIRLYSIQFDEAASSAA